LHGELLVREGRVVRVAAAEPAHQVAPAHGDLQGQEQHGQPEEQVAGEELRRGWGRAADQIPKVVHRHVRRESDEGDHGHPGREDHRAATPQEHRGVAADPASQAVEQGLAQREHQRDLQQLAGERLAQDHQRVEAGLDRGQPGAPGAQQREGLQLAPGAQEQAGAEHEHDHEDRRAARALGLLHREASDPCGQHIDGGAHQQADVSPQDGLEAALAHQAQHDHRQGGGHHGQGQHERRARLPQGQLAAAEPRQPQHVQGASLALAGQRLRQACGREEQQDDPVDRPGLVVE
jgi:hypothetical protein